MKKLILFLLIVIPLLAYKGVDVSELFNLDTFQCFVRNGAQFAIVQAYTDNGNVD